jgi:hypothetical protein
VPTLVVSIKLSRLVLCTDLTPAIFRLLYLRRLTIIKANQVKHSKAESLPSAAVCRGAEMQRCKCNNGGDALLQRQNRRPIELPFIPTCLGPQPRRLPTRFSHSRKGVVMRLMRCGMASNPIFSMRICTSAHLPPLRYLQSGTLWRANPHGLLRAGLLKKLSFKGLG